MSGAISATSVALATVGGLAVSQLMKPKTPKVQAPAAPKAPPQAAKAPDEVARRASQAATTGGMGGGQSSTLLTGAGGINPGTLNLGKSTLLGQ